MRANAHGINDLGDTYIEVDLTEQYMWYYQNGNIIFQSKSYPDCQVIRIEKTPWNIHTEFRSSPSVLRGEMTAMEPILAEQPVTYWMPFNGELAFMMQTGSHALVVTDILQVVLMDTQSSPGKCRAAL